MNAEKRFAERLQELVYDCGLKPEEISALCGVGLSRLRCWLSPRCASLPCTRSLVKLADFFGCSLLYLLDDQIGSLSGGNQQKVVIARAQICPISQSGFCFSKNGTK